MTVIFFSGKDSDADKEERNREDEGGEGVEAGVYKVPYYQFIKSGGEEYQAVKKGREYHGCGEEYSLEKREGEAI